MVAANLLLVRSCMTILYVTQNGITDHIGRSQVAPYVIELAKRGFKIHVLSAEKKGQDILISEYQQLFNDAGVRWTYVKYLNKPPILGQFITQVTITILLYQDLQQTSHQVLYQLEKWLSMSLKVICIFKLLVH